MSKLICDTAMSSCNTTLEADATRKFAARYNIQKIETGPTQYYSTAPSYMYAPGTAMASYYDYYTTKTVEMITVEMMDISFADIVNKLNEYDELMANPETRSLIMEAKFLHRLRHGTTF